MARILAVDPGLKRVGLALSDPLQLIATPFRVLGYTGTRKLVAELVDIIKEKEIELVIIGHPGGENERPSPVCQLAEKIATLLGGRGIKAILRDEQYTSSRAAEFMREGGMNARKMKGKLDMVAASLLLEEYLKEKKSLSE